MRMHALISAGIAGVALATAAVPALAWVDFEWYMNVGRDTSRPIVEIAPAPREGFIWVAGRRETRGAHREWVAGHWIKDDYEEQVVAYNMGNGNGMATFAMGSTTHEAGTTSYATGPMILRDRQGNIIPTNPSAYPIGYSGR